MEHQKNTKIHNIFLIDKNKLSMPDEGPVLKIEKTISDIMNKDKEYKLQLLKPDIDTQGFSIKLYFREEKKTQNKFAEFCKLFVLEGQKAVRFYPKSSSSVLFIWNDLHIYAITTGQGFRMVEPYSLPKFGLIVASIFENEFKITSLDSNTMSGIIHSTKTVYSNEVDFIDASALDTVFKDVTGRLKDSSQVRRILNLPINSKRTSMKITAKDYVQFSSALDFNGLLHLLSIIEGYKFENHKDRFNSIAPLNEKENEAVISSNNNAVIREMYSAICSNRDIPFDLFNKETAAYISADEYVLYDRLSKEEYAHFDDYTDSAAISNAYREYLKDRSDSLEEFNAFINSANIRADKEDVSHVTDAPLLQHISGEIQVDDKNYFIFYGQYYFLNESYTDRLNEYLHVKLRPEFYTSEIKTRWSKNKDEDWFNKTVSDNENYVHLHKVTPDYIEFADLLKFENDIITIVHVKDGFDCKMRDLDRQVELSVNKIMDIKQYNNKSYFISLYNKAALQAVGKNIKTVFPTANGFISCIKDKSVRYVIAIRPDNKDLLNNTSNIAKHCLNAMISRCFQQGIELRIQILDKV